MYIKINYPTSCCRDTNVIDDKTFGTLCNRCNTLQLVLIKIHRGYREMKRFDAGVLSVAYNNIIGPFPRNRKIKTININISPLRL